MEIQEKMKKKGKQNHTFLNSLLTMMNNNKLRGILVEMNKICGNKNPLIEIKIIAFIRELKLLLK